VHFHIHAVGGAEIITACARKKFSISIRCPFLFYFKAFTQSINPRWLMIFMGRLVLSSMLNKNMAKL
jgi:hypothetical protein